MTAIVEALLAVALIAAGLALALLAGDEELWIFRGQPLGVVLAVVGALDLAAVALRRR